MDKFLSKLGFDELDRQRVSPKKEEQSKPEIDPALTEIAEKIAFEAQEVEQAAKTNLDFLAALATPEVYRYAFPPVLKAVWYWLLKNEQVIRGFPQLALGIPRGFAKTFLLKLFILYCILFTKRKFILIVSENKAKACNIISDICDMLNEPNIISVFGRWDIGSETDRQDLKKFGFRGRNIVLMGAGVDSGIRGITLKNERPDIIVFDDIQSRQAAESETQSTAIEREMIGTAMKAKSPHGCMFVFVANMYPTKYSLLKKMLKNDTWTKFICGGILADGTSLWEELHPLKQLLQEFKNDLESGHPEIFYSEVLNDPNAIAHNLIDTTTLTFPFEQNEIPTGKFVVIDPANNKEHSDCVAVGLFYVMDARPALMELTEENISPRKTIEVAIKYCLNSGARLVAIESYAFQYTMLYWFNEICKELGITGIQAVPVYPGMASKNSRILDMFKILSAKEMYVHPKVLPQVALQIHQFNPLKRDNTDGILDLLSMAPLILNEYPSEIMSIDIADLAELEEYDVDLPNTTF